MTARRFSFNRPDNGRAPRTRRHLPGRPVGTPRRRGACDYPACEADASTYTPSMWAASGDAHVCKDHAGLTQRLDGTWTAKETR